MSIELTEDERVELLNGDRQGAETERDRIARVAESILAARLAAAEAEHAPLTEAVERGAECFHGSPGACTSYRCGSNCANRFDRMHPCPACLIAEIRELRDAEAERAALVERALAEHRREWADWLSNWDGAVCPEPPTIAAVVEWLRADSLPFGCVANPDAGGA